MKLFTENRMDKIPEGRLPMPHDHDFGGPLPPHEHHGFRRPIPPHERKAMMPVEFDEDDFASFFDDPDTARAAAYIIQDAPPEIQILAIQLMKMNGSSIILGSNSSGNVAQVKFPSPTMDEFAQDLYTDLYGEAGSCFVGILNSSPNEIAVISRLIAHLDNKEKEVL